MAVNKDQISLSNWFDNLKFHYLRGSGHVFRYILNRYRWFYYPKRRIVSNYPEHVDIELSSSCNMKCPMCYTITDEFKNSVGRRSMDWDLYKRIVDDCAQGGVFSIRLSWRGEPTLHKKFIEAIKYAKDKGIKEVSTLTNALFLKPEMFEEMVKLGFDWLIISADGTHETYEKIRKPAKFDDLVYKIKSFHEIKKKYKSLKPAVKMQTIWPAIKDNPDEYFDTFSPYVDQVSSNQLLDYLYQDSEEEKNRTTDFECHVLYQRMTIGADGKVFMCYCDELQSNQLGDMSTDTIHELWHSDGLQKAREAQKNHSAIKEYSACSKCFLPLEHEAIKKQRLKDGREVSVDVVKGRSQVIGK